MDVGEGSVDLGSSWGEKESFGIYPHFAFAATVVADF